jgi:hypothetical protein
MENTDPIWIEVRPHHLKLLRALFHYSSLPPTSNMNRPTGKYAVFDPTKHTQTPFCFAYIEPRHLKDFQAYVERYWSRRIKHEDEQ